MKKIIVKIIALLILTTLVACNKIENTDSKLTENEQSQQQEINNNDNKLEAGENQEQKVNIDYEELKPYLRYFYMQYGCHKNIKGPTYVSELYTHFYKEFWNSESEGIDAVLVHSIIDETENNNFEKPFKDAHILTEAQEKRIDNGEYTVDVMADGEEYFMYSNTKEKYYISPDSASGRSIAIKIIDCKKKNDLYIVTYNVWEYSRLLDEKYDIEELLENESIVKLEDLNELNIMKESKEKVEIKLKENENYNYSKYKMIDFRILNDN